MFETYAKSYDVGAWSDNPFDRRMNFEHVWEGFEPFAKRTAAIYLADFAKDNSTVMNLHKDLAFNAIPDVGDIPLGEIAGLVDQLKDFSGMPPKMALFQATQIRLLGPAVVNQPNFSYLAPHFLTPIIKQTYPYLYDYQGH
jgi:hypothetical protein